MRMDRKAIARISISAALRMRLSAGFALEEAICVYDLAERLGLEVRFADFPSMDGMYCRELGPTIILSSLRPSGRRAFTCAHELGHHSSGDGTLIDHLVEETLHSTLDSVEFAADCFAGALLMPKMAVLRAFNLRQWDVRKCTPGQIYTISCYFGVGYSTLIYHMQRGLQLLHQAHANTLLRVARSQAQAQALGWRAEDRVWIVDPIWAGRPIDVEAGDLLFVRGHVDFEGNCLVEVQETREGNLYRAAQPGIGRLFDSLEWSAFLRVSRPGFVGRSIFRHLEEAVHEGSDDN